MMGRQVPAAQRHRGWDFDPVPQTRTRTAVIRDAGPVDQLLMARVSEILGKDDVSISGGVLLVPGELPRPRSECLARLDEIGITNPRKECVRGGACTGFDVDIARFTTHCLVFKDTTWPSSVRELVMRVAPALLRIAHDTRKSCGSNRVTAAFEGRLGRETASALEGIGIDLLPGHTSSRAGRFTYAGTVNVIKLKSHGKRYERGESPWAIRPASHARSCGPGGKK